MLTAREVERFISDGFVYLPEAFPRALADECRAFLWRETGADPADPAAWTRPVVRLGGYGGGLFSAAASTPALQEAFDQLAGPGRWIPRTGLGTFPVRFPHPADPGDAGWHMEGSYTPEGERSYWLNQRSRGRALLMLFLFSEVGPDDAPTRVKVGSHLDVPPFLAPTGEEGMSVGAACAAMDAAGKLDSPDRALALATGAPGTCTCLTAPRPEGRGFPLLPGYYGDSWLTLPVAPAVRQVLRDRRHPGSDLPG